MQKLITNNANTNSTNLIVLIFDVFLSICLELSGIFFYTYANDLCCNEIVDDSSNSHTDAKIDLSIQRLDISALPFPSLSLLCPPLRSFCSLRFGSTL